MTVRVTLREIAAETGVSLTTVSKVLNGGSDVSSATRGAIEEQLRLRGYRRRGGAGRREYIEVVLPRLHGEEMLEIVDGILTVATAEGMAVSLAMSGDVRSAAPAWTDAAVRRRPAGVIVLASGLPPGAQEILDRAGVPVVLVDPAGDPEHGLAAVGAAHWTGGLTATRHLIDLGHRRIAAIMGPSSDMSAVARMDGYRAALAAADLEVASGLARFASSDAEGAETSAREMLSGASPPSAIVAGSDAQAVGVIRAARELRLTVPAGLSVVGFGGLTTAALSVPRLTTVRLPLREIAETAARAVLRPDDEGATSPRRVELATTLVVGGSTAPPARKGGATRPRA
ncbi:substrate-binding domain-containing protein [Microbacterium sp. 1P10UB]|uniref:LacI family DNA-binding transcriptional regulator n=1 Tax=unclassified Microbacterium TaxID=2609290 RepID=UPI0039A19A78